MKDSDKVKAANERFTESLAKMLEEAGEERRIKQAKTEKERMLQDSKDAGVDESKRPNEERHGGGGQGGARQRAADVWG